jgi:hypothetical protein
VQAKASAAGMHDVCYEFSIDSFLRWKLIQAEWLLVQTTAAKHPLLVQPEEIAVSIRLPAVESLAGEL